MLLVIHVHCVSKMIPFLSFFFGERNIFRFWPQGHYKDDIETEMWKRSEMDLHSIQEGEEEEESDRKYSSDITLCVNPDFKTNSPE